ncbi:MAG TPA: molybdopterin-dependent oxidoreductase [Acetobacteraceae bacterium]
MFRRDVLVGIGAAGLAGRTALAGEVAGLSPMLPAGTREEARWSTLPGKQRLIQLADRPPNYEAPIGTFREAITPNDKFFVRYHLAGVPDMKGLEDWSLSVDGDAANGPATLTMDDLRAMPQAEVNAVCQCSGSRRGLSNPHVAGVQWGYGAMGCATFHGPRLRDVLAKAGVKSDAVEIWLDGADGPVLPTTPDFRKSLPMDKAMADDTIVAIQMNGAPLPLLNGYPARVIVPGWTATYWMKHVNGVHISSKPLDNFWMAKAYRVPANMFPVDHPFATQDNSQSWPITEMVVNTVIAEPLDGARVQRSGFTVKGVAWDRGSGIGRVEVSLDDGHTWQEALLDRDLGKYAFRSFSLASGLLRPGTRVISARATSNAGEQQVQTLKWNPAGYHNNVPQKLTVHVA